MLRKSLLTSAMVALLILVMRFAFTQAPRIAAASSGTTGRSGLATDNTSTYVDNKLGFGVHLAPGWVAHPRPGRLNNGNTAVYFTNPGLPSTYVEIGVMRSPTAPADFAQRGPAPLHIGSYPAFQLDTWASTQIPVPCLGRIMLVGYDTVIATWCASDAPAHRQQFETILASYQAHGVRSALSSATPQTQTPVNPVLTCSQVIQNPGPRMWGTLPPSGDATFGSEQVYPTDSTWTNSFGEGVAVCDDYYSGGGYMWENSYLFQCVELANRFINEEWGLTEFTVDAFAYYDSYQNGSFVEGQARSYFGSQVQQIDDASQGNNSAPPSPGDLLIFQDVNNGSNWTSGEKCGANNNPCTKWDPGHVAIVTSVTSSQVNLVQQNFNANGAIWSLQLQHLSNGYHIVDNSGVTGRITRGWIHFNEGGSPLDSGYTPYTWVGQNKTGQLEIFARGSDNAIWHNYQIFNGNQITWSGWSSLSPSGGFSFVGDPVVGQNSAGPLEVFARGTDNQIYHIYQTGGNPAWSTWAVLPGGSFTAAGNPTVARNTNGKLEVFVRGSDNQIYHSYQTGVSPGWSTWAVLPGGTFTAVGNPTVARNSSGSQPLEVFVRGSDNQIYHSYQTGVAPGWSTWASVNPGGTFTAGGDPTVGHNTNGTLEVFVRGSDNQIYHSYQTGVSPGWSIWAVLPGGTFQSAGDPKVGQNLSGPLEVFTVGSDSAMWHSYQTGVSPGWSTWASLGTY